MTKRGHFSVFKSGDDVRHFPTKTSSLARYVSNCCTMSVSLVCGGTRSRARIMSSIESPVESRIVVSDDE